MTLTQSQLDELDREVAAVRDRGYRIGVRSIHTDAETLAHLVAVYRAALALDEACDRGADVSVMAERLRAVRLALVGKDAP